MKQRPNSIQVIDRLVQLLDALARDDGPVSLKILSAETGLHPSTAFRILACAHQHGLVERDGSGRYSLGAKLLQLGGRVTASLDLTREARPIMEWLRDQVGETVNLAVREGDEVVYVERVTSRRMIRVEQVVGSRAPLHVTAVGKMMLADEGDPALVAYARRTGLPRYTSNTLTSVAALRREVDEGLRQGYALDNEEAELGVGCIGVPVRDGAGRVVGGLSVSAPIERRREEWVPLVMEAGRRISARMGYRAPEQAKP
jgi:DNA-binding IclR family transcriptional regulator